MLVRIQASVIHETLYDLLIVFDGQVPQRITINENFFLLRYDHVRPKASSVVRHVPEKFVPLGGASESPWQLDSGSKEEQENQEPDGEYLFKI